MTHEDDIPELIGELAESLGAPEADALRAGLASRQKRRRGAASIAAVLAVAGIGFGAWAITADDATTTETAAGTAEDDVDGLIFEFGGDTDASGSVADDSAPRLEGFVLSPDLPVRDQMVGATWAVGALHGDSQGFEAQRGSVSFTADLDEVELPADMDTVVYANDCSGSAYVVEWLTDIDFSEDRSRALRLNAPSFRVIAELDVIPSSPNVNCVELTKTPIFNEDAVIAVGQREGSTAVTMGVFCPPLASCTGQGLWDVELFTRGEPLDAVADSATETGTVLVDPNCSNLTSVRVGEEQVWTNSLIPTEWQNAIEVPVTVERIGREGGDQGFMATDADGRSASFRSSLEQATERSCLQWFGTATFEPLADEPPPTTSIAPGTTAPPLAATPPTFSTIADPVLSGQWELVSLWNEGDQVDLAGLGGTPTISIFGRQIGGNDACNSQGGGLIYVTADGSIRIEGGATTDVGCGRSLARQTYNAALYSNDQWGFTSSGNLVLGTGETLAEYRLVESLPAASLVNLSAPLNTLWASDSLSGYDSFNASNSTIDLHFEGDSIAVVTDEVCGEFGYQATYVDANEGPISFEFLGPGAEPCEATGDAATVLEAMARADYFATAPGGVMFWDGAQPLATFATE